MINNLPPNILKVFYGSTLGVSSAAFYDLLSFEEKEKAGKIRALTERDLYIIARARLRELLAFHLNTYPSFIEFEYGLSGKPFVKDLKGIQFSVAHTKNTVAIGLTRNAEIGLDIEHLDRVFSIDKLSGIIFSPNELNLFHSAKKEEQQEAFINCWTRKEAFIKARGSGFRFPLDQLEVTFLKGQKVEIVNTGWSVHEREGWFVESFDLPGNYRGAVAAHGQIDSFELIDLQDVLERNNMLKIENA